VWKVVKAFLFGGFERKNSREQVPFWRKKKRKKKHEKEEVVLWTFSLSSL